MITHEEAASSCEGWNLHERQQAKSGQWSQPTLRNAGMSQALASAWVSPPTSRPPLMLLYPSSKVVRQSGSCPPASGGSVPCRPALARWLRWAWPTGWGYKVPVTLAACQGVREMRAHPGKPSAVQHTKRFAARTAPAPARPQRTAGSCVGPGPQALTGGPYGPPRSSGRPNNCCRCQCRWPKWLAGFPGHCLWCPACWISQ